MTPDFTTANHGTIVMLTPCTPDARDWVDENLPADVLTLGEAIAIEPRYFNDIAEGIIADGLVLN